MKQSKNHLVILITGAITTLQLQLVPAEASTIWYSGSGQIVPNGTNDPWQIGAQGQPFLLKFAVSRDALDLLDVNVEFAAHEVDNASLFLDGQEVPFAGDGVIDFTDDWSGLVDLMVFHGDFEQFGQVIEIGSLAVIPTTSFRFAQISEVPPIFRSTANTVRAACCGGPYASIVAAGTAVTVVAEPTSVLGAAWGLLFVAVHRRR